MLNVCATTFDDFRILAKQLVVAGVHPRDVLWSESGLFGGDRPPETDKPFFISKNYVHLAKSVSCHADIERWGLLYEAFWRIQHGEKTLLDNPADRLTSKLQGMAKQVGRDVHKMHAFVRFRKTEVDGMETFLAWHRPDHRILTLAAPFFVERFRNQRWGIATPDECCSWDMNRLSFGEGLPQAAVSIKDDMEDLWRVYYRHIFNPARIKVGMMKSEMPVRHWRTLPETQDIPAMLQEAPARVEKMMQSALFSSERSLKRAEIVKRQKAAK